MQKLSLIKFGTRLAASKLLGQRVPFQVNIHINDKCNLRCKYCYIDFDHPSKDLALENIKMIVTEARELGGQRISLEGGEPLLHKDIGGMIDLIDGFGMESNINTNGHLIPKRIDALKNVDLVSVSLDGEKAVHDRSRGEGSFEQAVQGIKVALAHGLRVQVLSVLTKENRHSIDYILDLAKELGFSWVPTSIFLSNSCDKTREMAHGHLQNDEEYRELLKKLLMNKKKGFPIVWSEETLNYVLSWPTTYAKTNLFDNECKEFMQEMGFRPLKCQAARYFCVVQTNGNLYSCDPMLGYGPRLNCIELGFKEAFSRLTTNGCRACNQMVVSELHQLFSLKLGVMVNLLRNYAGMR